MDGLVDDWDEDLLELFGVPASLLPSWAFQALSSRSLPSSRISAEWMWLGVVSRFVPPSKSKTRRLGALVAALNFIRGWLPLEQ